MGTLGGRRMPARGSAWLAAVVLLVQPLVMAGAHAAAADGASGSQTASKSSEAGLSAEALASKQAVSSGSPVDVAADTTSTDTVTAQPDGTFRLDASPVPVRARQGDTWVPVDTTLQVRADGSVRPAAAAVGLSFSGGGGAALATVSQGGTSYSISAPWTLPTPSVSGSTATYASVLPDVDLVVTAVPDGFTENVVVRTRDAAADPRLASLSFPVAEQGLTVRGLASGGAALVDGQGRPVFTMGSALAWDSATSAAPADTPSARKLSARTVAGPADVVDGPAPGANTSVMDVDVTSTSMTVTPDQGFLSDPSTVYPVVLDPQTVSQSLAGWTALWSGQPSTSFWKTGHSLGVGYDLPADTKTVRSLYQFDTHGVEGKKVLHATFTAEEVWSYNCTATPVELWHTGGISSSTTWSRPPSWMSRVDTVTTAKGWSSACPGGNVEFDATGAVAYSADRDGATTTLGLKAPAANESDPSSWKQFASPSDTKPVLSVVFVSAPSLPTGLRLSDPSLACGVNMAAAVKIRDLTPRLAAAPKSADGSQSTLRPNFEVHRYDAASADPLVGSGSPSAWTTSGTAGNWTAPTLTNGQTYWFRARTQYQYSYNGTTGYMYSSWTPGCWFTIDDTAPLPPTVTSTDYPQCASPDDPDSCPSTAGVGQPGTFKMVAGASDVVTYSYILNEEKMVTKTFSTAQASYSPPLVPNQEKLNTLTVQTADAAGNVSLSYTYFFMVSPGLPAKDNWSFDEGTGSSAADSIGGHSATLSSGAAWSSLGRVGSALSLDSTKTSSASVTLPTASLDTSKSFTISAWARLSNLTQTSVIASQDGTQSSSFSLYYSAGLGKWAFNRNASDVAAPTVIRSESTAIPVAGVWTHLLGVYDKDAQTILLYVNGVPQGDPVAFASPWTAGGPFRIGGGQYAGVPANYFAGQIDEVELWNRIVSPTEITGLEGMNDSQDNPRPALVADWEFNETSGPTAADSSDYGRTASLAGGASFFDDSDDVEGTMGNVVSLNGSSSSYLSTPGPIVDSQGDFTVSTWVQLDKNSLSDTSVAHTVRIAGQSGTTRDSWGLWYSQPAGSSQGSWMFGRTEGASAGSTGDSTTATVVTAPADLAYATLNDAGAWTMVTGISDAANKRLILYVNGEAQNTVGSDGQPSMQGTEFDYPWQPTGTTATFSVGRGATSASSYGDYPTGLVEKVRLWTGTVSDQAIKQMAQDEAPAAPPIL